MSRRPSSLGDMTDAELAQWGMSQKPVPPKVASGRITAKNGGVVPSLPGRSLSVFSQTYERPVACVVSLGSPGASPDASSYFPPGDQLETFLAGVRGNASWNAALTDTAYAAAVLTYGAGASSHRVVFDWRPGSYQLPPVEYVELSVMPWGAGWAALPDFTFAGSCAPGILHTAHVPTVTARAQLTQVAESWPSYEVGIPARARALDVAILDSTQISGAISVLHPTGAFRRTYDASLATGQQGPVECMPGLVSLVGQGGVDLGVALTFFLGL